MANLRLGDVFRFMRDLEYSSFKLWEIARRYDPVQMAAFVYILENATTRTGRQPRSSYDEPDPHDEEIMRECLEQADRAPRFSIGLRAEKFASMTRVDRDYGSIFATPSDDSAVDDDDDDGGDMLVLDFLAILKRVSDGDESHPMLRDRRVERMMHNVTTAHYRRFLASLNFLLFPDNLQGARDVRYARDSSTVRLLRFYKMMTLRGSGVLDPRTLRYVVLPRPTRIYELPVDDARSYVVQPLYQGFHVVLNVTDKCAKTYNRYAEYRYLIIRDLGIAVNCTIEAVIVPLDRLGRERSWRYWPYRRNYRVYVVDVMRYESESLLETPFDRRMGYLRAVCPRDTVRLRVAPVIERNDGGTIAHRQAYERRRDPYDSVIGLVLRDSRSLPTDATSLQLRYDVVVAYDRASNELVDARDVSDLAYVHHTLDMAPMMSLCVVYAHTDDEYHVCRYEPRLQHYVHAASIARQVWDDAEPRYRAERIYVVGARALSRGILLLRIYYTREGRVIGYESKLTDGRFDVPLRSELFSPKK